MIPRASKEELKALFAGNLNRLMELNNAKTSDIANAMGLSYMTVSDWVNGKSIPRMDKIEMLANYFDVSKSELIEEYVPEQKNAPTNSGDAELDEYLDELRSRPEMRMYFSLAKGATKEDVETAARIVEAYLKGQKDTKDE